MLLEKGRIRLEDGGESIIIPLMYAKNSTVKSYSGYDPIDLTPQTGIDSAKFNWKQIACSVIIDRLSERKNAGAHRIINLLEAKIQQAEDSMKEALNVMLYADGTGNSSKDFLGLDAIVDASPTTGTLGGINRADYSWWRPQYNTSAYTTWGGSSDTCIAAMRAMYYACSKGANKSAPDLVLMGETNFSNYEGALDLNKRFTSDKIDATYGFENIKFKKAIVLWDEEVTDPYIYYLNLKFLELVIDKETNFITTPFATPDNQDCKVAKILLMGNLAVSNCKKQGVTTGIT